MEEVDTQACGAANPYAATTRHYPLPGGAGAERDGTGLHYVAGDALGTPIATYNLDTGALLGTQLRAPYGQPRSSSRATANGGMHTTVGFTGQREDSGGVGAGVGASGLDYFHARYYDPAVGRFASADSVSWSDPLGDAYAYVGGMVENATDPSGHFLAPSPVVPDAGPEVAAGCAAVPEACIAAGAVALAVIGGYLLWDHFHSHGTGKAKSFKGLAGLASTPTTYVPSPDQQPGFLNGYYGLPNGPTPAVPPPPPPPHLGEAEQESRPDAKPTEPAQPSTGPTSEPTPEPGPEQHPTTDTSGGMCGARDALAKRICGHLGGNRVPGGVIASFTDTGQVIYEPGGVNMGSNRLKPPGAGHSEQISVNSTIWGLPGAIPKGFVGGITLDIMTYKSSWNGPCGYYCQPRIDGGVWLQNLAGAMPGGVTSLTVNWWIVGDDASYSLYTSQTWWY